MQYFVIGQREIVLAFKMTGIDGVIADTREQVLEAFNRVTGKGGVAAVPADEIPRVLILTEEAASLIEDEEIQWQKTGKFPLIVEVPGINGHIEGRKTLTDSIREAIGINI